MFKRKVVLPTELPRSEVMVQHTLNRGLFTSPTSPARENNSTPSNKDRYESPETAKYCVSLLLREHRQIFSSGIHFQDGGQLRRYSSPGLNALGDPANAQKEGE